MKATQIKDKVKEYEDRCLKECILDAQARDEYMTADEKRAEIASWQWCLDHEFPYSNQEPSKKVYPTIIDHTEVFDSEGTLTLMSGSKDMLYLEVVDPTIDPIDHQKIIDVICQALGTM